MNKYIIIAIVSVTIAALSQILLKISANKKYESKIKEYLNPLVIIAYGIFFASAILSTYSLKGITISLSTIIETLGYILVPIFSYTFLKEKLSKIQIIGIIVIIVGIIIFNL